jgi:transposase
MKTKELEISEKIEIRLDMIYAHTKLGKTIREVITEFDICLDTYYYWYHRYLEKGIFGLFDSKKGPKVTHNKTKNDVASKIVETAYRQPEMDAPEILEVLDFSSVHKPSVATAQRILQSKGLNRPKGRRSKKTMEKKMAAIQSHKQRLKK